MWKSKSNAIKSYKQIRIDLVGHECINVRHTWLTRCHGIFTSGWNVFFYRKNWTSNVAKLGNHLDASPFPFFFRKLNFANISLFCEHRNNKPMYIIFVCPFSSKSEFILLTFLLLWRNSFLKICLEKILFMLLRVFQQYTPYSALLLMVTTPHWCSTCHMFAIAFYVHVYYNVTLVLRLDHPLLSHPILCGVQFRE